MNSWVKTKKLTSANSHMINETIFYIAKKTNENKASLLVWAYLYPSGHCVFGEEDKYDLIQMLEENIDTIENKIKEKRI